MGKGVNRGTEADDAAEGRTVAHEPRAIVEAGAAPPESTGDAAAAPASDGTGEQPAKKVRLSGAEKKKLAIARKEAEWQARQAAKAAAKEAGGAVEEGGEGGAQEGGGRKKGKGQNKVRSGLEREPVKLAWR